MNSFFDTVLQSLDFWVVLIVFAAGFFQKAYFKGFSLSKDSSYDSALKTLFTSAIASAIYIALTKNPENGKNWAQYFISYFAATSFYELLLNPFTEYIKSKFKSGQ